MNKAAFYAALRRRSCPVFGTSLSQGQVNGLECLLADGMIRRVPLRQMAYVLATAYHETAHTMQPIMEYGGAKYLKSKPYWPYVGRGYVQLTWEANYLHAGKELGLDLADNPDLAMRPDIASHILFAGMSEGWFTGKRLSHYISDDKCDYVNARRIVNGTDRASDVASYAKAFKAALWEGGYAELAAPQNPPVTEQEPVPAPSNPETTPNPSAGKSGGLAAGIAIFIAGIAALWAWATGVVCAIPFISNICGG